MMAVQVTNVSPNIAPLTGGTSVVIDGTDFNGVTGVSFGGTYASSFVVNSPTRITAVAPAHTAGTVDIRVMTYMGMSPIDPAHDQFFYQVGGTSPTPTITGLSVTTGSPNGGTPVTITGTNFNNVSSVTFGGTIASFTVNSPTSITAYAPSHAAGLVDVVVFTSAGATPLSTADQFLYAVPVYPPMVNGLSVNSGSTAGGTYFTIYGSNFSNASSVLFGEQAASTFYVNSPESITVTSPSHAAGVVDVRVVTAAGTSALSAQDRFTYLTPPPSVTGLSTGGGLIFGGTQVTIHGSHFDDATRVWFGDTEVTSFTITSSTAIEVAVPAHGVGMVNVSVETPSGNSANNYGSSVQYSYYAPPAPTITSISQSAAPVSGGTLVTITGTDFTGASSVTLGSYIACTFTVVNSNTITFVTPNMTANNYTNPYNVHVSTPGGWTTSPNDYVIQFTQDDPVITSLSANTGTTDGGEWLDVVGTNFGEITHVLFGNTPATQWFMTSPESVRVKTPAHIAELIHVSVVRRNSQGAFAYSAATPSSEFTYLAGLPTVTSLDESSGWTLGGELVTIFGTHLSQASQVWFGTIAASSFTVISDSEIHALTPAHAAGVYDIRVETNIGTSANTGNDDFTFVVPPPKVISLDVSQGPSAGGTTITITGERFTGATEVRFGDQLATFTVVNDTTILATSPAHAPAVVDVVVVTPDGTSEAVVADQFVYDWPAPILETLSAPRGSTNGGTSITITGQNFVNVTHVRFGTVDAAFTVVSASRIDVTLPAHSAGTCDVTVETQVGASSIVPAGEFTFVDPPSVASLGSVSGSILGGDTITITGANFYDVLAIRFGDKAVTSFVVHSDTLLEVITPASDVGVVDIQVVANAGISAATINSRFAFVVPAASVTHVDAPTLSIAGGGLVTLKGRFFTGASQVDFGQTSATWFEVVNDTTIRVLAPAHDAGTVHIRVTTTSGISSASDADRVEYVVPTVTDIPIAVLNGNSVVDQGKSYVIGLNVTQFVERKAGLWQINWGDGSPIERLDGNRNWASHIYATESGSTPYTISAVFSDTFTSVSTNELHVNVQASVPWVDRIGHWQLVDGTGTRAIDSTKGAAHARLINGAAWTAGPLGETGTAVALNGQDQYLAIGHPTQLNFGGPVTVSTWVKTSSSSGIQTIIAHGNNTTTAPLYLRIREGSFQFGTTQDGAFHGVAIAVQSAALNRWVSLTGTFDGSTWSLFVDGELAGSSQDSVSAQAGAHDWAIGSDGGGTGHHLAGAVANVQLFDRGLTAAQVKALYSKASTASSPPWFIPGPDLEIRQGTTPQTFAKWATGIEVGDPYAPYHFEVTASNPTLFANLPSIDSDGNLTITPAEGQTGAAELTVVLVQGKLRSAPMRVTVVVTPFVSGTLEIEGSPTVAEDAPYRLIYRAVPSANGQKLGIDWGDGTTLEIVDPGEGVRSHVYRVDSVFADVARTVTVTLFDELSPTIALATAVTTVVVQPVNHSPTIKPGAPITVAEGSGSHNIANWATNITTGPGDESNQSLTIETINNNQSLFAVQPTLTLDGTLAFTLNDHAAGIATVTVTLTDNGGVALGGRDSISKSFAIIVKAATLAAPHLVGPSPTVSKTLTPTIAGTAFANATVTLFANGKQAGTGTANANGEYELVTDTLAVGTQKIVARATSPTKTIFSAPLTILVKAPITTLSPPRLAAGSDSGASQVDRITNDNTPTFEGTAPIGSSVTLLVDGESVGTVVADADGGYQFTTPSLADGAHTIAARGTDAKGNELPITSAIEVTILTATPTAPSAPTLVALDNNAAPLITGSVASGWTVKVFVDGVLVGTTIAKNGAYQFLCPALSTGLHLVTIRVVDIAGNISGLSSPLSVTIPNVSQSQLRLVYGAMLMDASGGWATFSGELVAADGNAPVDVKLTWADGFEEEFSLPANTTKFAKNHYFAGDAEPNGGWRVEVKLSDSANHTYYATVYSTFNFVWQDVPDSPTIPGSTSTQPDWSSVETPSLSGESPDYSSIEAQRRATFEAAKTAAESAYSSTRASLKETREKAEADAKKAYEEALKNNATTNNNATKPKNPTDIAQEEANYKLDYDTENSRYNQAVQNVKNAFGKRQNEILLKQEGDNKKAHDTYFAEIAKPGANGRQLLIDFRKELAKNEHTARLDEINALKEASDNLADLRKEHAEKLADLAKKLEEKRATAKAWEAKNTGAASAAGRKHAKDDLAALRTYKEALADAAKAYFDGLADAAMTRDKAIAEARVYGEDFAALTMVWHAEENFYAFPSGWTKYQADLAWNRYFYRLDVSNAELQREKEDAQSQNTMTKGANLAEHTRAKAVIAEWFKQSSILLAGDSAANGTVMSNGVFTNNDQQADAIAKAEKDDAEARANRAKKNAEATAEYEKAMNEAAKAWNDSANDAWKAWANAEIPLSVALAMDGPNQTNHPQYNGLPYIIAAAPFFAAINGANQTYAEAVYNNTVEYAEKLTQNAYDLEIAQHEIERGLADKLSSLRSNLGHTQALAQARFDAVFFKERDTYNAKIAGLNSTLVYERASHQYTYALVDSPAYGTNQAEDHYAEASFRIAQWQTYRYRLADLGDAASSPRAAFELAKADAQVAQGERDRAISYATRWSIANADIQMWNAQALADRNYAGKQAEAAELWAMEVANADKLRADAMIEPNAALAGIAFTGQRAFDSDLIEANKEIADTWSDLSKQQHDAQNKKAIYESVKNTFSLSPPWSKWYGNKGSVLIPFSRDRNGYGFGAYGLGFTNWEFPYSWGTLTPTHLDEPPPGPTEKELEQEANEAAQNWRNRVTQGRINQASAIRKAKDYYAQSRETQDKLFGESMADAGKTLAFSIADGTRDYDLAYAQASWIDAKARNLADLQQVVGNGSLVGTAASNITYAQDLAQAERDFQKGAANRNAQQASESYVAALTGTDAASSAFYAEMSSANVARIQAIESADAVKTSLITNASLQLSIGKATAARVMNDAMADYAYNYTVAIEPLLHYETQFVAYQRWIESRGGEQNGEKLTGVYTAEAAWNKSSAMAINAYEEAIAIAEANYTNDTYGQSGDDTLASNITRIRAIASAAQKQLEQTADAVKTFVDSETKAKLIFVTKAAEAGYNRALATRQIEYDRIENEETAKRDLQWSIIAAERADAQASNAAARTYFIAEATAKANYDVAAMDASGNYNLILANNLLARRIKERNGSDAPWVVFNQHHASAVVDWVNATRASNHDIATTQLSDKIDNATQVADAQRLFSDGLAQSAANRDSLIADLAKTRSIANRKAAFDAAFADQYNDAAQSIALETARKTLFDATATAQKAYYNPVVEAWKNLQIANAEQAANAWDDDAPDPQQAYDDAVKKEKQTLIGAEADAQFAWRGSVSAANLKRMADQEIVTTWIAKQNIHNEWVYSMAAAGVESGHAHSVNAKQQEYDDSTASLARQELLGEAAIQAALLQSRHANHVTVLDNLAANNPNELSVYLAALGHARDGYVQAQTGANGSIRTRALEQADRIYDAAIEIHEQNYNSTEANITLRYTESTSLIAAKYSHDWTIAGNEETFITKLVSVAGDYYKDVATAYKTYADNRAKEKSNATSTLNQALFSARGTYNNTYLVKLRDTVLSSANTTASSIANRLTTQVDTDTLVANNGLSDVQFASLKSRQIIKAGVIDKLEQIKAETEATRDAFASVAQSNGGLIAQNLSNAKATGVISSSSNSGSGSAAGFNETITSVDAEITRIQQDNPDGTAHAPENTEGTMIAAAKGNAKVRIVDQADAAAAQKMAEFDSSTAWNAPDLKPELEIDFNGLDVSIPLGAGISGLPGWGLPPNYLYAIPWLKSGSCSFSSEFLSTWWNQDWWGFFYDRDWQDPNYASMLGMVGYDSYRGIGGPQPGAPNPWVQHAQFFAPSASQVIGGSLDGNGVMQPPRFGVPSINENPTERVSVFPAPYADKLKPLPINSARDSVFEQTGTGSHWVGAAYETPDNLTNGDFALDPWSSREIEYDRFENDFSGGNLVAETRAGATRQQVGSVDDASDINGVSARDAAAARAARLEDAGKADEKSIFTFKGIRSMLEQLTAPITTEEVLNHKEAINVLKAEAEQHALENNPYKDFSSFGNMTLGIGKGFLKDGLFDDITGLFQLAWMGGSWAVGAAWNSGGAGAEKFATSIWRALNPVTLAIDSFNAASDAITQVKEAYNKIANDPDLPVILNKIGGLLQVSGAGNELLFTGSTGLFQPTFAQLKDAEHLLGRVGMGAEMLYNKINDLIAQATPYDRGVFTGALLYEAVSNIALGLAAAPTAGTAAAPAWTAKLGKVGNLIRKILKGYDAVKDGTRYFGKALKAAQDFPEQLLLKATSSVTDLFKVTKPLNKGIGAAGELADDGGELYSAMRKLANCSEGCFIAGTPVSILDAGRIDSDEALREALVRALDDIAAWAPNDEIAAVAVAKVVDAIVPEIQIPIETVGLGRRVATANPRRQDVDFSLPEPEQSTWRRIVFRIERHDGAIVEIESLRPLEWIEKLNLRVGKMTSANYPELEINDGEAEVVAIDECPPIDGGPGSVVISRIITRNVKSLVRLSFADGSKLVGTNVHPAWRLEDQTWTAMGKFAVGDHVASDGRALAITAVEFLQADVPVYNLEIHGEHVYEAGAGRVLVHNVTAGCQEILDLLQEYEKRESVGLEEIQKLWDSLYKVSTRTKQAKTDVKEAAEAIRAFTRRYFKGPDLDSRLAQLMTQVSGIKTIGVGTSTVKGLENVVFESGSKRVLDALGRKFTKGPLKNVYDATNPLHKQFVQHMEEDFGNQFIKALLDCGYTADTDGVINGAEGVARVVMNQLSGTCAACKSGCGVPRIVNGELRVADPGVVKQLSMFVPNVTFRFEVPGDDSLTFVIRGGKVL